MTQEESVKINRDGIIQILIGPDNEFGCIPVYFQGQVKTLKWGTSLVVQWLRILLPIQGTQVRALVQEDPTCRRATKPVCHNY